MDIRYQLKRYCSFVHFFLFPIVLFFTACQQEDIRVVTSTDKLWYQSPADASVPDNSNGWVNDDEWLKALPLGNGSLGAMVFGDVNKERIQLSEESMWSGSPDEHNNPLAYPAQKEIRKLLFEEKHQAASILTKKTQICAGKGTGFGNGAEAPFGCFQTLGDLWIDFEKTSPYTNYHRELNLEDATVNIRYEQDGVVYHRSVFISQPDQLMVMRLSADQPGQLSFKSTMTRPERFETTIENNQLVMRGQLADGQGGDGLSYVAKLAAINKGGNIKYEGNQLIVEQADEVVLLLTASTDYQLNYPNYKGRDCEHITTTSLKKGTASTFNTLLNRHKKEYQAYYKRVDFNLTSTIDSIPTDARIQQFDSRKPDLKLVELLFQYGRYLLIASSRPGTLAANLQGVWANKIQTPWNGDYHTDVNVQMNYWLAESTNLNEMHLPLMDLIASLQAPGSKTARIHYNADGWLVHPVTNIWGFTAPGESADWGMHVGAGAWLSTHIMEHYYYTLDTLFLKNNYTVLKASTQFYMDWLVPDPETGELLSGPSVSPENSFLAPDRSESKICMGPAHDQQVIWQLFKNFLDASSVLAIQDSFVQGVALAQKQLAPPKIAIDGRLMEWHKPYKELEPGHRHISHLFALHPGYQIDIKKTPELALAAKKSLDFRIQHGGGHTGWSAAWLINQYARLGDAENAAKSLNMVLTKSISPNLFGQHPPFQMDANFGTAAGIAEMLLQSQSGEIRLLPALPNHWTKGKIKGLCARGGFVVDMEWDKNELTHIRLHSKKGGTAKLSYKGKAINIETEAGKTYFPQALLET